MIENTALGNSSAATEYGATAVGYTARATGYQSTATGVQRVGKAQLMDMIAMLRLNAARLPGAYSGATGTNSTAIGAEAEAKTNDTAVGYNSTITADNSTAVGANSAIFSTNSVAIGADSVVSSGASGGTALGQNYTVQFGATNSVALGSDSVASEADTVSVGSSGSERRVTNVAAGVNATDAVNVANAQVSTNTSNIAINSKNIATNTGAIALNRTDIDQNTADIAKLETLVDDNQKGNAMEVIGLSPGERFGLNVGMAQFKDEYAIGVTGTGRLTNNLSAYVGVSATDDQISSKAGIQMRW